MKKIIILFLLFTYCNTWGQKINLDKKRDKETFELTIKTVPYKKFIINYVNNHAEAKNWQTEKKDSCKNSDFHNAKIKLLVSINYKGKIFVSNHYSSPSLSEWVEDIALENKVKKIARELEKIIKKNGIVKPPLSEYDKKYINDEVVIETVWEYKCI